jgi:DNA-binding transcriptional regulator YdaS (Cro superfamily)
MITFKQTVHFTRGKSGRRRICDKPPAAQGMPLGRIPRISKLMALAIRFDRLLHEGKVTDQSELARLAQVTQPRMTQIMNLLHLAPDIQEALLLLPRVTSGNDPVNEKQLRPLAAEVDWHRQRKEWQSMLAA